MTDSGPSSGQPGWGYPPPGGQPPVQPGESGQPWGQPPGQPSQPGQPWGQPPGQPSQPGQPWGQPPGQPGQVGQPWGQPPGQPGQPGQPWGASAGSPYQPATALDQYNSGGQPAGRRKGNGKAIAGFIFGILALLLFWLTLFDLVLVVLGIVFSALGISAARRGAGLRKLAISGLVLSILGGVAAVGLIVLAVSRNDDCKAKYGTDTGEKYNRCLLNLD